MYPVAPVKKMRMALHHNSSTRRETLLDFFDDFAGKRGDFLVYEDGYRARVYTYRETAVAARRFAARLQAAGIGKGDKVLFWSENRPEWIIALWGCLLNGSVTVPIDYRSSVEFLSKVASIVAAKAVLLGDDVQWGPESFSDEADEKRLPPPFLWRLSEIDWTADATFTPVDVKRDDVAEIIFTSGATA